MRLTPRTRGEKRGCCLLVVASILAVPLIGALVYALEHPAEALAYLAMAAGVAVLIACLVVWDRRKGGELVVQQRSDRLAALTARFGAAVAERIMAGEVWQGQTEEQLQEALGAPAAVNERVLKTKTKHVWKYHAIAANRYALHVMLEDGVVVGWEDKE